MWTSIASGSFGATREPDVFVPQLGRANEVERSDKRASTEIRAKSLAVMRTPRKGGCINIVSQEITNGALSHSTMLLAAADTSEGFPSLITAL